MIRFGLFEFIIFLLMVLLSPVVVWSTVPHTMSLQGVLQNDDGSLIADGPHDLTFTLYDDATGGAIKWSETLDDVEVIDGLFDAILGKTNSLAGVFIEPLWLGVQVDGGVELAPRTELVSVPYAHTASSVEPGAAVTALNGLTGSVILEAGANIDIAQADNTLTISATGGGGDAWLLTGNAGTSAATDFVGTTDDQPLVLKSDDEEILRLVTADGTIGVTAFSSPIVEGGFDGNSVVAGVAGATVAGGGASVGTLLENRVTDHFGSIGGGSGNVAGSDDGATQDLDNGHHATVGGGDRNTASGRFASVGGGSRNVASRVSATVSGGNGNTASGGGAAVGGGDGNEASGLDASIGGGEANIAGGDWASVAGGLENEVSGDQGAIGGGGSNVASGFSSVVGGGSVNMASGDESSVGGGFSNEASGVRSTVSGGFDNEALAAYATIGGGGRSELSDASTRNRVLDDYGTIGGGGGNQAGNDDAFDNFFATVAGGSGNVAGRAFSSVGGGRGNTAGGNNSTIGGGSGNTASGIGATVGGGSGNMASGIGVTLGGGSGNTAGSIHSTIAGGDGNLVSNTNASVGGGEDNTASGFSSRIGGGKDNEARDNFSTVGGGEANTASGEYGTVPGGDRNAAAGDYSFAAGQRAKANHDGAFVWADEVNDDFSSTAANQFLIRAGGGVGINTNAPTVALEVNGEVNATAFNTVSDRNAKTGIERVDGGAVLAQLMAVPIQRWTYKSDVESVPHMGPMAQDFHAAFGVGSDSTRIASVDADGVALASIQGLYELVQVQQVELAARRAKEAALEEQVAAQRIEIEVLRKGANNQAQQMADLQAQQAILLERLAALEAMAQVQATRKLAVQQ